MQMRAFTQPFLPGMIILWHGTLATVPKGWALCDGSNGTPDLNGRFVMAAGDTHAPNTTGGSEGHTHDFAGDGHTHGVGLFAPPGGMAEYSLNQTAVVTGTTNSSAFKPSFYKLAYIMKL